MHVISEKALRVFWKKHADAERPLRAWLKAAEQSEWKTPADVQRMFSGVDIVGRYTVFDIKGNSYRLIAAIHYNRRKVYVRAVLTHEGYDRNRWKEG